MTPQTLQLDDLRQKVTDLNLPGLGEEADWLGKLDEIIRLLRDHRANVIEELDGPVSGSQYRVVEGRSASRSYNTAAILHAFNYADWSLQDLMAVDAVRLSWRWSELRKAYQMAALPLTVAGREVEDDGDIEAPAIGEVWSSSYRVEAVK